MRLEARTVQGGWLHNGAMSSASVPDEALMVRYGNGDAAAFEELYDRHERRMYRFFLRSVRDAETASDLLQETWISVVRASAGYTVQARFATWLYRIARTRLVDHWRSRDPAVLVQWDAGDADADDAALQVGGPAHLEPERQLLGKAQARAYAQAVEALPPPQREAFLLHAESGLALEQIGQITGAGVETVKSRLRYASAKLRERLREWESA
jgi:RNA polymerase sigma factor (sigma-70 family)